MSEPIVRDAEAALIGGRYRLEQLLGRGGMGTVHAALDIATGRHVALKRLSVQADARQLALFEREYHTLHSLRHARIVEVYDYGSDSQGPFYTMELLSGGDLSSCAPIGWRQVCTILGEVASILGVLHARRLVHRDLSPKNLWRLPDGHIKLIDFGALAPFGVPSEIIGTPAFVPPEAARRETLDQRADLYALGALGYWLATSMHAYPARSITELSRLWKRTPASPSSLARLLKNAALEPIPHELDVLITSLLRQDPAERPLNTEVLVDRLNAISGHAPDSHEIAVEGYLASKAFVGRRRERERVAELWRDAQDGRGGALLIEAARGMGRTRLLEELAVTGRLAGAVTLSVDGSSGARPYGVANALALRLLDRLPVQAARAAGGHAPLLGHISTELRERLSVAQLAPSEDHAELRLKVQTALTDWLCAVSREHPLLILIDELEALDEESAAWIGGFAHELAKQRVLLVASAARERGLPFAPVALRFRSAARRLRLAALTAAESQELLQSVFGAVPYLQRFSDRLHNISEGNPAHCLELAEYLVRTGVVPYKEGTWVLPSELAAEQLPRGRGEAYALRLERVGADARRLAQTLSIQESSFSLARALALAEAPEVARGALAELIQSGVLLPADQGYRFAHERLRESLRSELDPERRAHAHRRLGRALLEEFSCPRERLWAAVHLFRGGQHVRAERLVREAGEFYLEQDLSGFGPAVPAEEEIVALFRAQGRDAYSLVYPLTLLAISGYFVDRRLGARYGETAVTMLVGMLRLELARKLRRFLGAKLALGIALGVAAVALALRWPRAPSLRTALTMLLGAASALAGMAACCIDPKQATRYADAIEPLAALGPDHAAGFIHRFCRSVAQQVQDRPSASARELRAMIVRLESGKPIRDLPEHLRVNYLAGCVLALGITECWREGPEGLKLADKLEAFGPLYEMSADHLRASYYEAHGDLARAAGYRERVERHAIRLGSTWQMDTWAPADSTKIALRTQDAIVAKRAAQELDRLALEVPSLALEARHARGTYCMLRGDYADAVALLDTDETPASIVGWARTRGSLARAHNGQGNHQRAREVCLDALARLSREDLQYSVMNLNVQIELALADAGLGQLDAARALLDRLLVTHADNPAPLTLGALHEARAKVASLDGDSVRFREHALQMERWYRPTGIATLIERCERLTSAIGRASQPEQGVEQRALSADDAHLMTRVQLMLTGSGRLVRERAHRALEIAIELAEAEGGFIVLSQGAETLAAFAGEHAPEPELVAWARARLLAASTDEATAAVDELTDAAGDSFITRGGLRYCVAPLWQTNQLDQDAPAALVLAFADRDPHLPPPEVLHMIADTLVDTARA